MRYGMLHSSMLDESALPVQSETNKVLFATSFIDHKNLSPLRSVETPQETFTLDISRCRQSMSTFFAQFYMLHQVLQELCTELGRLVYGLCTYAATLTRRAAVSLLL
jgi:hypothetical protein